MSLFAGIYSKDRNGLINEKNKKVILKVITTDDNIVKSYSEQGFFLAKADFGAFQDTAFLNNKAGCVAALAGDPVLRPPDNIGRSRTSVLEEISSSFLSGQKNILRDCQGIYNLCWYDTQKRVLILVSAKTGVRPLYYYENENYIYFSGNLGVLESLKDVTKRMDLVGITEKMILGSFLGRRTPYADIQVLRGGEYLEVQKFQSNIICYFKWDDIPVSSCNTDELLDQTYQLFNQAVAVRAWREESVFAFLSGGMDSRAIVTSLWDMGKKIYCGNISFPGSQDAVYPKEFADVLGLKYYSFSQRIDGKFEKNRIQYMMSELISQISEQENYHPRFPRLVLAGEGGSVGFGHVYMHKDIVEKMRKGEVDHVITNMMKKKYIPRRLMKKNKISQVEMAIYEDLSKELKSIHSEDPGRSFYIFLLNNDQRCHMFTHFEDINLHQIESLTPFYDGRFLELIVSVPVDICLYHNFYTQFFEKFPSEIKSVPWQTYPGHLPCTVVDNRKLAYQWSANEGNTKFYSKAQYDVCKKNIFSQNFPKEIVNRPYLLMALLLHNLNIKNYSSEFNHFANYHKYYSMCDGSIVV